MQVCIQGEEMQTQLLLDTSPYVYKPAQLPLGKLHWWVLVLWLLKALLIATVSLQLLTHH